MSEIDFLKLKKHDNVETNTEKFDIENYLNGNWDKINENAKKVNTDISNINSKNKEQDTNIEQLQENTETSSNKIAELEKELKEAQEDFYQNSIRGQASGEYIHVEDSSNCRARIGTSGNHEQETREGYNLLNNTLQSQTINGLKVTVNEDKSVAIVGTATDATPLIFDQSKATLPAGTYILKDCGTFIESEENHGSWNSGETKTFTADATLSGSGFYKYYGSGEVVNVTLYPILIKGSELKPYEQYGAMPSPDYRSEVKSVGSNVNIYDKETMPLKSGLWIGGTLDSNITTNSRGNYVVVPIVGGKTYTISKKNATGTIYATTIASNAENGVKVIDRWDGNSGLKSYTIKTSSTAKYLFVGLFAGTPSEEEKEKCIEELKVEKGTVATPYSKYGQGCVKVTKCNKNILKNIATSGALNGVTRTVNEDKSVTINGTSTGWANLTVGTIKGDGNSYTLSGSLSNSEIFLSVNNSQEGDIAQSKNGNEITFIPKRGLTYNVIICIPSGKTFNNVLIKPLVRISSDKDNTYEQHEEQSYIMPVQKEMLQGDYFDFDNEEEVHTWGKYIFTGEENMTKSGVEANNSYWINQNSIPDLLNAELLNNHATGTIVPNFLSTHFKTLAPLYVVDHNNIGATLCANNYNLKDVTIRFGFGKDSDIDTADKCKTWLKTQYDAGTPVIAYYKLATPNRLKFTDEQKAVAKELNNARTYKNVTNITTDSKAILSLDYAKDLETLLNNTQALAVNNASEGV